MCPQESGAGITRAETLAREETASWLWLVRWFKAQELEQIHVGVDAAGRIALFSHQIPEGQSGASVEAEPARAAAEEFLQTYFGTHLTDTNRYKLLAAHSEKKEKRVDHEFVWERIDRKVEDGEFLTLARWQGDQAGYVRQFYRAPEAFLRQLNQEGLKDVLTWMLVALVMLGTLVLGGVYFFREMRDGQMAWNWPIRLGLLAAAFYVADSLNETATLPDLIRAGWSLASADDLFFRANGLVLALLSLALLVAPFVASWTSRRNDSLKAIRSA